MFSRVPIVVCILQFSYCRSSQSKVVMIRCDFQNMAGKAGTVLALALTLHKVSR